MKKKKILIHGTLESLKIFFSDAVSSDYEVVALLSDENISSDFEVVAPQNLPHFVYKLADGIILTNPSNSTVKYFLKQKIAPSKIILWDEREGWGNFNLPDKDGTQIIYFYGLEFHIRNQADMNFFKMIYSKIQFNRQVKNWSPQVYPEVLTQIYRQISGRLIDFNNLQTFTEKMQWIKIYDATPLKSRLADKYTVRAWVADKIGQEYLIPLLGVWDNFDDINFDYLPNQFVLKCNHGSGMNIIVRDKKNFDKQLARERINAWLALDFSSFYFELHYTLIDRKIIAEKFMTDSDAPDLTDYKFWCFGGKPVVIQLQTDTTSVLKIDHFDLNWKLTNILRSDHPNSDHPEKIPPPKNFELMKKLAAKLAEGFPFVRVDFYEIEGKVYFGEMTFTPGAGNFYYKSEDTDEYLGSLLKLPEPTPPPRLTDSVEYHVRQKFLTEIKFPSTEIIPNRKIIASLTSWTKRISTAHLAIQTILNQTRQPDLTVLYLADEEFPRRENDLPPELLNLRSERFEIRWTKNIRSYKKLIPALKDFPEEIIITFDDDLFFHPELIERLLVGYKKYPTLINCHRINRFSFDAEVHACGYGNRIPYDRPTYLNKLSGGAACLYPPHCLHKDVLDEEKFMTLAPTNDDIWFWLMGVLNERRVNVVENNIDTLNYIPGTQEVGLWEKFNRDNNNKFMYEELENILKAYPVLREILHYEQRLANGE